MALQKRTAIAALIIAAALVVVGVLLIPTVFGFIESIQTIPSTGYVNPGFSAIGGSVLSSLCRS
jgi:hypothetical protein